MLNISVVLREMTPIIIIIPSMQYFTTSFGAMKKLIFSIRQNHVKYDEFPMKYYGYNYYHRL